MLDYALIQKAVWVPLTERGTGDRSSSSELVGGELHILVESSVTARGSATYEKAKELGDQIAQIEVIQFANRDLLTPSRRRAKYVG